MVPRSTCRCVEFLVFLCLLTIPTLAAALPRVPVIDISSWTGGSGHGDDQLESPSARQQVVSEMREACRNVGFFQITNHGVNSEILETTWRTAREFFEQPREVKLVHKTTDEAEYPYGFEETEQLSKGKELDGDSAQDGTDAGTGVVDTKETFAIGPDNAASGMPTRRWRGTPAVPEFRPSLESYYSEMEKLADVLLEIFALALGQTSDYFVDKTDHHMSALRLVHYYPLMSTNQTQGHVVRAGAHTDYGALTILNSQRAGLEVLVKGDSAAQAQRQWYPVPVVPGALIVNLGDLMQRWTNDEWVSTMHRVVMPTTDPGTPVEERYSMAYFVNVNGDTLVQPLASDGSEIKYPPVTAKDHLMAKHLASMGEEATDDSSDSEL